MPGFNRKGPNGEGPMTGRKMGQCNPENKEKENTGIVENIGNFFGFGRGRGRGMGQGKGRGMRCRRNDQ